MTKRSTFSLTRDMSTHQAQAPNMTETSVIKHYKKQLIYRQHDISSDPKFLNEVSNTKIYAFELEKIKKNQETNGKRVKRKRKNKNCRGQFRHEAMELIKLGTNPSHSLCKIKEPFSAQRTDKPPDSAPKDDKPLPQPAMKEPQSVIHTNYTTKPILEPHHLQESAFGHALPQMVPERRNSRELQLKPPVYRSPPHRPPLPEYRPPYPQYCQPPLGLPPPPPYPVPRTPPRPVPRSPIRPIAQPAFGNGVPYPPFAFNGYRAGAEHPGVGKRRRFEKEEHPVVAAIDLTVDHEKGGQKHHKCHCECGKTYANEHADQEVIITVKDREISQVPSTYMRGKMVNGVLQFDQKPGQSHEHNGNAKNVSPNCSKVPGASTTPENKLPQLFLIEDLLSKGVRVQPKNSNTEKEKNRVIVSTKSLEEPIPRPKSKDYTVSTIIGSSKRQSVDVDTISISSSGSERSPRPKSNGFDKQIPHGKLFYYKNNNSFIRYFDDMQKKLFIDSITSDGQHQSPEDKEVIELPKNATFNSKDNLTVEEYVSEMILVEKFVPRDFFLFYKFVTGYQICNNNLPVSFLTFLKVYNTNGLKVLLERYVQSLKQN